MNNFVRCHAAVQLLCSEAIIPSIQKVLEDWHQQRLRENGSCTKPTCPKKGKPNARNGFCQSCIDWGRAIEKDYFPQRKNAFIRWNNANLKLFCKDPVEIAKVFVLRLPHDLAQRDLDDFDAASILMLAMHFKPYHHGNIDIYDKLQKVLRLRNELGHLNIKHNMELDDGVTVQYFDDVPDVVPFLTPLYFTQDVEDQIQFKVTKTLKSPISDRMKEDALSPLSEGMKSAILELIEGKLKARDKGENHPATFDIAACRRHLREHYLRTLCKIPKHPGDSETYLDMDEIYTNLSLHYEIAKPSAPIKIPLNSHHEMFTRKVNGMLPKRILVLERGGSGKSTFFAKLAYDLATENAESPLKDVPVLFALNMRWMQYSSSVEDAILSQVMPMDTEISTESLRHFIRHIPDKIMILLDSYDEFSRGEIIGNSDNVGGNVVDILANKYLTSCRVLVSSRNWRASDFSRLNNVYAKIDVDGFTEDNVKEYIMKNFPKSPESGKRLCNYLKSNNMFQIASNPLMAQLFCLVWKETKEEHIPNKMNDLYTAIFNILYNHLLAKGTDTISKLSLNTLQEVVLQLGKCAAFGLWPPENRLVFSYEEMAEMTSVECVEDGCKTGIISVSKTMSNYKPAQQYRRNMHEQKSVVFFHKSAQEKCAGEYLAHLANTNPDEFVTELLKLDSARKCLSVRMVLRFACGDSLKATELILEKLLSVIETELLDDVYAYYDDTLKDPEKAKLVQEFLEIFLLCNYESGATDEFNPFLTALFPLRKLQFLGLSPYTSSAIGHFLHYNQTVVTQIKLVQIPTFGIDTEYGSTMEIIDAIMDTARDSTNQETETLCHAYLDSHQSLNDCQDVVEFFEKSTMSALMLINLWEYFKTWHSSNCAINVDPILDAVKFTSLHELRLINVKLQDGGRKLLVIVKQRDLIHLTQLILPYTGLSIDTMNMLMRILPKGTPKLEVLDISWNPAEESQVIVHMAQSLPLLSLRELHLDDMNAPADSMTALAQVIPQICANITALHIRGNYMDDETGKTLVATLPYAQQLKALEIDVDEMSKKVHGALLMTVGKLVKLERFGIYGSQYMNDLILYAGKAVQSLKQLHRIALGVSTDEVDVKTRHSLHRLTERIGVSKSTECSFRKVNRKSWRLFIANLQPIAAQMQMLYLWNVNLHKKDLVEAIRLCREYKIELGYSRAVWPDDVDIPGDVILRLI